MRISIAKENEMASILANTKNKVEAAGAFATVAAAKAAQEYVDKHFGGGDNFPCGFAWVTYTPKHKGNTRLGKEERTMIELAGFEKDWTGKQWQIWNPGRWRGQNVDAKIAAADAFAKAFERSTGVTLFVGSRLD